MSLLDNNENITIKTNNSSDNAKIKKNIKNLLTNKKSLIVFVPVIFSLIFEISFIIALAIYESNLKHTKDKKLSDKPLLCCKFARYYFIFIFMVAGLNIILVIIMAIF